MRIHHAIPGWFVLATIVVAQSSFAGTTTVQVREMSSQPNYATTTDRGDSVQLTDGAITNFPMWAKREAVGWTATSPVTISLDLHHGQARPHESHTGTLRIHTAKGLYAGVDVPHQIDVYSADAAGRHVKVGSLSPNTQQLADKTHHWLTVPVSYATDTLLIVLHARGQFLFLDEVIWQENEASGSLPKDRPVGSKTQALTDSIDGLRANLLSRAVTQNAVSPAPSSETELLWWAQDPWGHLPLDIPAKERDTLPKRFMVEGFQGEQESICLGLRTWVSGSPSPVVLNVTGLPAESVRLYTVIPIVAANGQVVYDPLEPLGPERTVALRTDKSSYAWISFDLRTIPVGSHTFTVSMLGPNGQEIATATGELLVRAALPLVRKPAAVNWAYINDNPIWRNPDVAFQDLLAHGINVFVLHPRTIPGVGLDGMWSAEHATAFNKFLTLARGKGTLLLYLGWDISKNPLGVSTQHPNLTYDAKRRLIDWVEKMSAYLEHNGFSKNEWAIYPVDEPRGANITFLETVAHAIKSVDPAIRLYADPTSGKSGRTSIDDLQRLNNLVDIWQPNLIFLREQAHTFFPQLNKPWWVYGNPNSPAKLGSPLHQYRFLAWWGWMFGASGVGFWSYSDTNGSSAWNDLDGKYPDWAVVYEAESRIVSSRRWEAFREGLEDYSLLSAVDRGSAEAILGVPVRQNPSAVELEKWNSKKVYDIRHELMDRLR